MRWTIKNTEFLQECADLEYVVDGNCFHLSLVSDFRCAHRGHDEKPMSVVEQFYADALATLLIHSS